MTAIERAIQTAPSMAAFAKRLGVSPQVISNWKNRGVPAGRAIAIESATNGKVKRHELRPDIYPAQKAA